MRESILILGATSAVARELSAVLAQRGCRLLLAGRDHEELRRSAADLRIRYAADAETITLEVLDFDGHADFFHECVERLGDKLTGVVLCYGSLIDQQAAENDFDAARQMIDVNFTSAVSLLNLAANYLQQRGAGIIAAVSSVAGDRGRQSNYLYGASKAALSVYLDGLRNRLHKCGVSVATIKPGFIDTPMTHGLLNPNSPLVASPQRVAQDIDSALRRRRNVVYTPWFWWCATAAVCSIPESVFKRMRL